MSNNNFQVGDWVRINERGLSLCGRYAQITRIDGRYITAVDEDTLKAVLTSDQIDLEWRPKFKSGDKVKGRYTHSDYIIKDTAGVINGRLFKGYSHEDCSGNNYESDLELIPEPVPFKVGDRVQRGDGHGGIKVGEVSNVKTLINVKWDIGTYGTDYPPHSLKHYVEPPVQTPTVTNFSFGSAVL